VFLMSEVPLYGPFTKSQLARTQLTSGPCAVHVWSRDPKTWGPRLLRSSPSSGGMPSNQILTENPVVNEMSSNAKVLVINTELNGPTCEGHSVATQGRPPSIQGYLVHKKTPPSRTLLQAYA